ncbi:Hypothetical predicted protein [Lecanosticta acicola]|uniref:NAD(P)-binding protein n=1 Tax=Lecanosticta acicola TaxID=111012 RepID=A0AAI9E7J9_9PEZI|nr:Hypothetical predicted protein [Lecanosticta acicola]
MGNFFSQSFFLPKPAITEHNCPDQKGRVFIVTGGYAGVGYELSRILFACNATVYVAGRSDQKASSAIAKIKQQNVRSTGRLEFLKLDLAELESIKPAVEAFRAKEQRLDVLVNNAGVMFPPIGSTTAQSHDLQVGTNLLGPYLLYKLLLPLLARTAASSPTASVRVAWAGSVGIEVASPGNGGMKLNADGSPNSSEVSNEVNYGQTKTGNFFFSKEFARSTPENGVVHVCFNPGNLRTELQRHWGGIGAKITDVLLLYPAVYGGYTELWASVAPEITPEKSGSYVWPWGRLGGVRPDVEAAAKSEAEGGMGMAKKLVAWCEKEVAAFA